VQFNKHDPRASVQSPQGCRVGPVGHRYPNSFSVLAAFPEVRIHKNFL